MDEQAEQLMGSKCEKDYKGHHYWEKLGVLWNRAGSVFLMWRCSQCQKCVSEELEFLKEIHSSTPR
jgi:hypothetical protein